MSFNRSWSSRGYADADADAVAGALLSPEHALTRTTTTRTARTTKGRLTPVVYPTAVARAMDSRTGTDRARCEVSVAVEGGFARVEQHGEQRVVIDEQRRRR